MNYRYSVGDQSITFVWRLPRLKLKSKLNLNQAQIKFKSSTLKNPIIQVTVFACYDFMAQFILVRATGNAHYFLILQKIYRCWIAWGYNIRVVIVPSLLAYGIVFSTTRVPWCKLVLGVFLLCLIFPFRIQYQKMELSKGREDTTIFRINQVVTRIYRW